MSVISYAQNFEDVILWRIFKDVRNGFYIDVGAQHPIIDSVSYLFYENGWRGVHIEPISEYANLLRSFRPDEDVLQMAVSSKSEAIEFFEFDGTGLSTGKKEIAGKWIESGREARNITVETISMDELLEKYKETTIHWLKIDIEGAEFDAISSWRNSRVRPRIIVVESTDPGSSHESFEKWDPLLIEKGYIFFYFDGLNRFYVDSQFEELIKNKIKPPNIFDDFAFSGSATHSFNKKILSDHRDEIALLNMKFDALQEQAKNSIKGLEVDKFNLEIDVLKYKHQVSIFLLEKQELERNASSLAQQLAESNSKNYSNAQKIRELEYSVTHYSECFEAIKSSLSWRITSPIRFAVSLVSQATTIASSMARGFPKRGFLQIDRLLYKFPSFRNQIVFVFRKIGIYDFLLKTYLDFTVSEQTNSKKVGRLVQTDLSPYAELIHIRIAAQQRKSKIGAR